MQFGVVVDCVIEFENRFLLIRRPMGGHGEGLLCLVGGKVELADGEDGANALLVAVKREVREEVGLELQDPVALLTSSAFVDSRGISSICIVFYCKLEQTNPHLVVNEREVPEYFWMTEEEIAKSPDAPDWTRRYIQAAMHLR